MIGSAINRELVSHGAQVLAVDHQPESLARVEGEHIVPYPCDITHPEERARLLGHIADSAPRYLVHSAGKGFTPGARVPDPFEWFAGQDVHLYSPMLLASELLATRHQRNETGSAVMLSSVHARFLREDVVYSSAKAGLEMAVRELASMVAEHGSRANVVAPGDISAEPKPSKPTKLGRVALAPESIAKSVRFLLCDDCSPSTTGASLTVDGGFGLWVPWAKSQQ